MKKIAMSRANFKDIVEKDFIYVDKTEFLYNIISMDEPYFFMSRPRRFGKSLSISTLQAIFEGRKELFRGLFIEKQEYDWEVHPIIKLDYNEIESTNSRIMEKEIEEILEKKARENGIDLISERVASKFNELIEKLSKKYKKGVVVLIDEYDKPIISHLGKGEERIKVALENREFIKSLYDNLKPLEPSLRLVYIAGVSKFSMTSIFSTLNNLIELDIHPRFADFLGYREDELKKYFNKHFMELANKKNRNIEDIYKEFKYMYNGFRFTDEEVTVYNPYSIGKALEYQKIDHYWFDSGTPTFLIDLIKEKNYDVTGMEIEEVDKEEIKAYDIEELNLMPLLYQTGYLTIKKIEGDEILTLGFPNNEVEKGFVMQLMKLFSQRTIKQALIYKMKKAFVTEDYDEFFILMKSMFASIPYSIVPTDKKSDKSRELKIKFDMTERELYYHTIFYLAVTLMSDDNLKIYPELLSNQGRIDMVIEGDKRVYLVEFKCNQSAEIAIKQIKDKKYAERYRGLGKKIVLLGIDFDSGERNIREWRIEGLATDLHMTKSD